MPKSASRYALVLAGGSGTRFWPLSRHDRPKQLLNLFDNQTLLEAAVARLDGIVPTDNILVLTNAAQEDAVRAALPALPADNIVAEPAKRDTAPAVALGIGWVAARDPSATMMVLPADQLIQDVGAFRTVASGAADLAARTDALVTIGIKPTWACPSYGYIERGDRVQLPEGVREIVAFHVRRFREKPNAEQAEEFIASGRFSWNAGMFLWSLPTVVSQLAKHCPELADFIGEIRQAGNFRASLARQFPRLTPISIDYALMERADRVLNVEATFDWDDVGSWISVGRYLPSDEKDNRANCPLTQIDSARNIVFGQKDGAGPRVALVGVEDLIVVQTDDAILVARQSQADKIKKLVEKVPEDLL